MHLSDICVLGGGWAGLVSAFELKSKYPYAKITVLEASEGNNLGGLLRSVNIDNFTFDTGGPHILFSRSEDILHKIISFLGDNVRRVERKAYIYYDGRKIPYPFENGMYALPPETRAKIGKDLLSAIIESARKGNWVPSTFREWMYGFFGNYMSSTYLEPYNRKIWKTEPVLMDASWVFTPGRLPLPSLDDLVSSIAGIESIGYKEQQFFYYPRRGGIQSLYNSLLKRIEGLGIEFITGYKVYKISKEGTFWKINDNQMTRNVVNTLPLRTLPTIIEMPEDVVRSCNNLVHNRVAVIGVAIDKPNPKEHVLYVPTNDIVFHRVTWMSYLTQEQVRSSSNLIAEVTIPYNSTPHIGQITDRTVDGLVKLGTINSRDEVLFTKAWLNEFGYPIYTLNHQKDRSNIMKYLSAIGINTVGRWGSWHYWNTDMVYKAVLEMVNNFGLMNGGEQY